MSIVVTGASGRLGRLVVEGLLARVPAAEIVAVVRDRAKAAEFAARGVEVRVADYSAPDSLSGVFGRGDRVLLISGSEVGRRIGQHRAVVDAAAAAGVSLLAYTSLLGAPATPEDFILAEEHKATEAMVRDSGLPYVLLRNGWYHENHTAQLDQVLASGAVVSSAGDGRIASASRADYADAAVAVLTGEGHAGRAYELSGDEDWDFAEFAAEVARQSGREVALRPVTPEEHRAALLGAELPEPVADLMVNIDSAVARGVLARRENDLARLIGRPTTPLAEAIGTALKG
ncbi:NAD(P)H-binding protein [Streptomyces physcomitrii]|uniref:NAD(P)H-binding protein n=1 Tax=Streptomyces physcomitrii TaxID=2724184 RepID=A0ABX1H6H0_9ACTN|nr:NAD(P)H-binding protein [Streptomyces physcomitrii]NKI42601.1 NAD(P)H-binding protein [Streptomyces physcomitrii]